jgi:hypothetical protein
MSIDARRGVITVARSGVIIATIERRKACYCAGLVTLRWLALAPFLAGMPRA